MDQDTAAARITDFYDKAGIFYEYDRENGIFAMNMPLQKSALGRIEIKIAVLPQNIAVFAIAPVRALEENLPAVSEYIGRINWHLRYGCLQVDWDDGQILYRLSLNAGSDGPDEDLIRRMFVLPIAAFDYFGDGLLSVMLGRDTPEQAAQTVFGGGETE